MLNCIYSFCKILCIQRFLGMNEQMEKKLQKLSKENLQNIVLEITKTFSEEQYRKLELLIMEYMITDIEYNEEQLKQRMSQEFVDEKMSQIKTWMQQIDDGEICLDVEEYEDYSDSYWDRDWIIEYYDNQGIGDKILTIIQFAKDCVDDRRYQEANDIYEWLWSMFVCTDSEWDSEPVDLETLVENEVIKTDMKQLALLTLYADYQIQEPANRAEDLYLYFGYATFRKLHIDDMFYVGRENLTGKEEFLNDWIALLQTKSGEVEARLLKEAVFNRDGIEGLVTMADENADIHPSLYLTAMDEYFKKHDYLQMENIGEKAIEKINKKFKIRSQVALKTAYASSCLLNEENVMKFCWEAFYSDMTVRNFLRLFAKDEMAKQYGINGKMILSSAPQNDSVVFERNEELRQNLLSTIDYYMLCFYTGDFEKAKKASKNPKESLGWSGTFMPYGIRLFLLYLYEKPLPSKAAGAIARYVGFPDEADTENLLSFENEIIEESRRNKVSMFWNYFQRWKEYFPISLEEKKKYLLWAEKIVYNRADALVGKQRRNHYGEAAELLAMIAEIKEDMGMQGAKRAIFAEYKRKFPRHSAFQAEMKHYFGIV